MGRGSQGQQTGDPVASTSFTVPVMAPSFFLITSLVRTVSDSIVFYSQGCLPLLPDSHYWTVKDSKKHSLSGPLLQTPYPKGPSLPHCLFCRSQQLRADRLGPP